MLSSSWEIKLDTLQLVNINVIISIRKLIKIKASMYFIIYHLIFILLYASSEICQILMELRNNEYKWYNTRGECS